MTPEERARTNVDEIKDKFSVASASNVWHWIGTTTRLTANELRTLKALTSDFAATHGKLDALLKPVLLPATVVSDQDLAYARELVSALRVRRAAIDHFVAEMQTKYPPELRPSPKVRDADGVGEAGSGAGGRWVDQLVQLFAAAYGVPEKPLTPDAFVRALHVACASDKLSALQCRHARDHMAEFGVKLDDIAANFKHYMSKNASLVSVLHAPYLRAK